ncbi:MAG: hypothetical protein ACKO91_11970, partial [Acidimicrobiales bacterium]
MESPAMYSRSGRSADGGGGAVGAGDVGAGLVAAGSPAAGDPAEAVPEDPAPADPPVRAGAAVVAVDGSIAGAPGAARLSSTVAGAVDTTGKENRPAEPE